MNAETRVQELQLELPPAPQPAGVYRPLVVVGNMAYVSGHGPLKSDRSLIAGRVGEELGPAGRLPGGPSDGARDPGNPPGRDWEV